MADVIAAGHLADDEPAAARKRLKGQTINGVAINVIAQLARFGLQFASGIAMARLLQPADFGLVAMTAPVVAFIQLFADLGLSQAAIQKRDITQDQLSILFWINVGVSLVLALVVAAASPLVGQFYGDHRVVALMAAFGCLLILGGLYSQHMALLTREMRFMSIAWINLAALVIGVTAGVTAALMGASYWSLVISQAANSMSTLVLAWAVSGWRPGLPTRRVAEMRELLSFGGNMTIFNVLDFFARNTDNILVGRVLGERSLGFYDRAYKLVLLPFNQVAGPFTNVALPLLSRTRDDPAFYRRAYQRMLESILLLTYPGLVFAGVTSHALILHVLGTRWIGVAPIFSVLVVDAFVAPVGNSMGWLFCSQGRTREMRNWGAVSSILFVAAFVIGLRWGPVGVAGGYVTAGLIEISFLWRVGTRVGPLRGRDLWAAVGPYLIASVVTAVLLWLAFRHGHQGWIELGLAAIGSYVLFLAALLAQPGGRRSVASVVEQLRQHIPSHRLPFRRSS